MSSWREQALIEAPIEVVWRLVGDPNRYPEWAPTVLEVTGLPRIDQGATYTQVTRMPLGSITTTFLVDELEEMRSIRLRCLKSGLYSQWVLTEARGSTFADVELGMEPADLRFRAADALTGKRGYRRVLEQTLDGLRDLARRETAAPAP